MNRLRSISSLIYRRTRQTRFKNSLCSLLLYAIIIGISFDANAQVELDWNRFRGPNGSGLNQDAKIPDQLSLESNLVWKTPTPKGYSSPVIHKGRIFLTAEEGNDLFTICLNQEDGKQVWRKKAPRNRTELLDTRNHPAASSVAADNQTIVVFFPDFGLIAYHSDGTEKWKRPLGPFSNLYGMGASPIIVDENVILVCDQNLGSFIAAYNLERGEQAWRTPREEATSGHCTPILFQPDESKPPQILAVGSFQLTSYDSQTGRKLWWVGGLCFEMKSTPVIHDDVLFINGFGSPQNEPDQNFTIDEFVKAIDKNDADNDGKLSLKEMPDELSRNFFGAVDLDADKSLNEKEWDYFRASIASKNSLMAIKLGGSNDMTSQNTLWKYHKNIAQLPSPLIVGNNLVMISDRGIATSLDPETGAEKFKGRLPGAQGNVYASPVGAGNRFLAATTSGKVAVVEAGEKLNVLSVCNLNEGVYATPAIANGRIFIRTDDAVYCFAQGSRD